MKAVILAGGYGTRLRPITNFIPKPLLPINGKPIIDYIIEKLEEIPEIDKIFVSTNKYFEKHFNYWITKLGNPKVDLVIEPTHREEEKFGSIAGITYLIRNLKINDDIIVVCGDNFFDFGFKEIIEEFKKKRSITVGVFDLKDLEKAKNFGVVFVNEEGIVTDFQEKPSEPKSTLIAIGCYIFPSEKLQFFEEYIANGYNPDAPGYFLQWIHKIDKVSAFSFNGVWFDIGNIESYQKAFNFKK